MDATYLMLFQTIILAGTLLAIAWQAALLRQSADAQLRYSNVSAYISGAAALFRIQESLLNNKDAQQIFDVSENEISIYLTLSYFDIVHFMYIQKLLTEECWQAESDFMRVVLRNPRFRDVWSRSCNFYRASFRDFVQSAL